MNEQQIKACIAGQPEPKRSDMQELHRISKSEPNIDQKNASSRLMHFSLEYGSKLSRIIKIVLYIALFVVFHEINRIFA